MMAHERRYTFTTDTDGYEAGSTYPLPRHLGRRYIRDGKAVRAEDAPEVMSPVVKKKAASKTTRKRETADHSPVDETATEVA